MRKAQLVEMPLTVKWVAVPNDDGTFDIYINSLLSEEYKHDFET